MKNRFTGIAIIVLLSVLLTGCSLLADIFQAGIWMGIIIVVLVATTVLFIVKSGKNS